MPAKKKKNRILLVGGGDQLYAALGQLLPAGSCELALRAADAGEARRMLPDAPVDLVFICTPLPDEFGVDLAMDLAEYPLGVLLFVKNELVEQVSYKVEDSGVFTIGLRTSRQELCAAVRLLCALTAKLSLFEKKNRSLQEKMADIRTVNRAKWLLIENLHMTEAEAHRCIEKQAMDTRASRREVAESIIRTYDN